MIFLSGWPRTRNRSLLKGGEISMAKEMSMSNEMSASKRGGHLYYADQRHPLAEIHDTRRLTMKAIVVSDQAAGTAGMKLMERPKPQDGRALSGANYGDVVVQVHASGFTWDELAWP